MEQESEVFEKITNQLIDEKTLARSILSRLHSIISDQVNGYGARLLIQRELKELEDE